MANTKYFTVTVPSTEVPSDQTDVPVYLDLSVLEAGHGFWSAVRSDGGDIRVYNAGGTQLAREIVSVDTVGKTGQVHFLADSLLSASNNVFTIEYGDGALTDYLPTDTYGRNAVWVDRAIQLHLEEDPSGTAPQFIDSSGGNDGTSVGTMLTEDSIAAVVGNGVDFDGSDDSISLNQVTMNTTGFISFWWKVNVIDSTSTGTGMFVGNNNNNRIYIRLLNATTFRLNDDNGSLKDFSIPTVSVDTWYRASVVRDGSNLRMYHNGVESSTGVRSISGNFFFNQIAKYSDFSTFHLDGSLDEFSASSTVAKSADYIAIEYANQNDPASFYTLSAEQDIGGGGGTTYDESFSIGQSNDLSPMGNIIVDDAIEIGQQSGILEESTLEGIASFALSNQNIISLASQLLAEDAVQINQVSSVTVNGGLTVEDSFTLALQNAMSFEATEAVVVSFSLGSQSSVTTEGQLDAQGSMDLAQASGLTLLDQLDASGTFVLNMQVAIGLLANAVVEAGLSISSLSEITVTGQSITSNVTLPDGRTLKIKLENRTLTIEKDNRTLDIS